MFRNARAPIHWFTVLPLAKHYICIFGIAQQRHLRRYVTTRQTARNAQATATKNADSRESVSPLLQHTCLHEQLQAQQNRERWKTLFGRQRNYRKSLSQHIKEQVCVAKMRHERVIGMGKRRWVHKIYSGSHSRCVGVSETRFFFFKVQR